LAFRKSKKFYIFLPVAYQFKKHFSLEEAATLLPTMAKIFEEIHTINQELDSHRSEADQLKQSAKTNGGGPSSNIHLSGTLRIQTLLEKVEKMGAFVKDLDRGLIDFPHLRGNQEVFLCWMVGEKKIDYWHDIESGFTGRQPL